MSKTINQKVTLSKNQGVLKIILIWGYAKEETDDTIQTGNKLYYQIILTTNITTIGFSG